MTAAVLDRVQVTADEDDDGLLHIFCCDPSLALCGVRLDAIADEDDPDPICADCARIEDQRTRCCITCPLGR